MTHLWWWLVVDAMATFRLTRLVTRDLITAKLRLVVSRVGDTTSDFITCDWCVSVWIAGVVAFATWAWPTGWAWIAAVLTFSAVAGILADRS
jgi:hypothetical protein